MGQSREKLREIERRIDEALDRPGLNNWSRTFLRDMRVRIAKYGKDVRFSEKQANSLCRLIDYDVSGGTASGPWTRRPNVTYIGDSGGVTGVTSIDLCTAHGLRARVLLALVNAQYASHLPSHRSSHRGVSGTADGVTG